MCRALVIGSIGYCAEHIRDTRRRFDATRGNATARGYDHAWRTRIRPAALAREPLCRLCEANGRTTVAVEVDHIDGNARNNDPSNLRALCKPCHSARTAREQAWGRGSTRGGTGGGGLKTSHWAPTTDGWHEFSHRQV